MLLTYPVYKLTKNRQLLASGSMISSYPQPAEQKAKRIDNYLINEPLKLYQNCPGNQSILHPIRLTTPGEGRAGGVFSLTAR